MKHKRHVPINEHAVLIGTGHDPRTRANHECAGAGVTAFCPACEPAVYAAMASRHAAPVSAATILGEAFGQFKETAASLSRTILAWD